MPLRTWPSLEPLLWKTEKRWYCEIKHQDYESFRIYWALDLHPSSLVFLRGSCVFGAPELVLLDLLDSLLGLCLFSWTLRLIVKEIAQWMIQLTGRHSHKTKKGVQWQDIDIYIYIYRYYRISVQQVVTLLSCTTSHYHSYKLGFVLWTLIR